MRRDASHVRTLFILKLYGFQLKFKSKWNETFQLELQILAKTPGQLVYSFQFVGLISRLVSGTAPDSAAQKRDSARTVARTGR
jgi:hypothetical protein